MMVQSDSFYTEAQDLEVNGPLFDSAIVEIEPESAEEATNRKQLIAQASRRVKRTEDDQTPCPIKSRWNAIERMPWERTRQLSRCGARVIYTDNLKPSSGGMKH